MKKFFIVIGIALYIMAYKGRAKYWDFESGLGGWQEWGTKSAIKYEKPIVTINTQARSGKNALLVRDDVTDHSPYAVYSIDIDPAKTYVFSGYLKSDRDRAAGEYISVSLLKMESGQEKHLKSLSPIKISVSQEWSFFSMKISSLPAEVSRIKLVVRPTLWNAPADTGYILTDDIAFGSPETSLLDLRPNFNRGFRDDSGAVPGGWTGQGDNDMRGLKSGSIKAGDIEFSIIDPAANKGKSVMVLRNNEAPAFSPREEISIGRSFDYLYLLHTAAWCGPGIIAGIIEFHYQDGVQKDLTIISGEDIGDWWQGASSRTLAVRLENVSPQKSPVFLFAASLKNPFPEKPVKKIIFRSDGKEGNRAIWLILSAVIGSGTMPIDSGMSALAKDRSKWFTFAMGNYRSPNALVNLSHLLDAPSGKRGFLSVKNGKFYFSDGTRARFWGVNNHSVRGLFPEKDQAERIAETLARYGVNIVRLHLTEGVLMEVLSPDRPSSFITNQDLLDKFDYFVKCLKDRGIYIHLDSVSGLSSRKWNAFSSADNIPDSKNYGSHRPWAFYEKSLISMGQKYMSLIFNHTNRYTKLRIADDPVYATTMLINEQSMFFDWERTPSEYYEKLLTSLFNKWLQAAYKTEAEFNKIWVRNNVSALLSGESFASQNITPALLKDLSTRSGEWNSPQSPIRLRDTVRFFKALQMEYARKMIAFIRSLGYKGPIGFSNIIGDLAELEAMLTADFTSHNIYWDHQKSMPGGKVFFNNFPSVDVDCMEGNQALIECALSGMKVNSHPLTSTETDMMWAHDWRSTYFLSLSATAALQDWDAIFQYAYAGGHGRDWTFFEEQKIITAPTCNFNDQALMALLPNASLIFHRRDVSPGKNLVQITYNSEDRDLAAGHLARGGFPFNYLAYVSRVESVFDQPAGNPNFRIGAQNADMAFHRSLEKTTRAFSLELDELLKKKGLLSAQYGFQNNRLISDTGEITRDWGNGLLLINSPRSQGISGFPRPDVTIQLADIEITCKNLFVTVAATSLDNLPLAQSKKILLSAVARAENSSDEYTYGQAVKAKSGKYRGELLTLASKSPLVNSKSKPEEYGVALVEPVEGTVHFKNGSSLSVIPLAPDFTALGAVQKNNGSVRLDSAKTVWYLISR